MQVTVTVAPGRIHAEFVDRETAAACVLHGASQSLQRPLGIDREVGRPGFTYQDETVSFQLVDGRVVIADDPRFRPAACQLGSSLSAAREHIYISN